MTLDVFKAQARRLQAFLKAHPHHAASLGQAKHASCLEAVAAVHGARNWNTLQAGPEVLSSVGVLHGRVERASRAPGVASIGALPDAPGDLEPVFSGLLPGQVQHLIGRSGTGKSYQTSQDLVHALSVGYSATVLDVGRSYHHLALAFGGVSTIPEQAATTPRLSQALLANLEFEGWLLTHKVLGAGSNPVQQRWAQVLPFLLERQGRGHVLVVDEVWQFLALLGEHKGLLVNFLVEARRRGSTVQLNALAESDLAPLGHELPADRVTVLHGRARRTR